MRVAILGHRGIPARYGGFETLAEQLGVRLAERGHEVTVYVRRRYASPGLAEYQGVRLVTLPSIAHKYLDTPAHTTLASLHALFQGFDAVLLLNAANAFLVPLLRLSGAKVALNVDGIEWKRKKWGKLGRLVYRISERLASVMPADIVTDARAIERYYLKTYHAISSYIAYGSPEGPVATREALDRVGLSPGRYVLYVSRLEPENNALAVVRAFEGLATERRLAVVGDAPYSDAYIAELKSTKDPRVLFPGAIFGAGYAELQSHAWAYVHATEVGGTHPALVEAMGYGNAVLCHRNEENEEVLGDAGLYFDAADPATLTRELGRLQDDETLWRSLRERARRRARERYSWSEITRQYERLFESMIVPGVL
ncbi:MAG: DUF1972 domain-containing protein [Acidobacteriota bacterium]